MLHLQGNHRRIVNRIPPFRNTQRILQQRGQGQGQGRGTRQRIGQTTLYTNRAQTSFSRQNAVQYAMDNTRYPASWRNTQYNNNNNVGTNAVTNRGYSVDANSLSGRQQRVQINNLNNNSIKMSDNNPVQGRPEGPIVYNPTVRGSSTSSVKGAKNPIPRVAVSKSVMKDKTDSGNLVSKLPAIDKPLVLSKASLSESLKSTSNLPNSPIKIISFNVTNTGNSKNSTVIPRTPVPIPEPPVANPSTVKPTKSQTKLNVSVVDSVGSNRKLEKKPVLLLVRKPDGTVARTFYKLRRTASKGDNKPGVPILSPVVANIPKILSSLSRITTNGTPVVRVVKTGSMPNNSSGPTSKSAGNLVLNNLFPPRIFPGIQSVNRVKPQLPNVIKMPLVKGMLSNINLQNRNGQALAPLNRRLPTMGSINQNMANVQTLLSTMGGRVPRGRIGSMNPFAQQPMSLMSMAGNWDGGSANVPLVFQRMGITHGSQLSPSMQERLFGDTIDPPDPTPTAGSRGSTQTVTGAEVEAEDLPPKPKPNRKQKKRPKGKRMRVKQERKIKVTKQATTFLTTSAQNSKQSITTPASKDIAVSLAKRLISLVNKGDPTANGILKSLNIDVPTIGAKTVTKSTPKNREQGTNDVSTTIDKRQNNVRNQLVETSVTPPNTNQQKPKVPDPGRTISLVPSASEKPKVRNTLTIQAQPIISPKKTLDSGEKISLSSFLSSNNLGGLKIERIIPELPQPSETIKPMMETPTSPPVLLQALPVQTIDELAKGIITSPTTTFPLQTPKVTTVSPTYVLESQKNPTVQIPPVKPNVDILFMPKVLPIEKMISSTLLATNPPSASPIAKQSDENNALSVVNGAKGDSSVDVLLGLLSQLNSANKPTTSQSIANKKITTNPSLPRSTTQPPTTSQATVQTSSTPPTKPAILPKRPSCLPSTPGFQCRGIDFFATVESMGKWCVDTCREKGCVRSVCECNCNGNIRPVFRNNDLRQGRRRQNDHNSRRWNRRQNRRQRGRGWQQERRRWQRPTTTTEEPPEIEDDDLIPTTTETMTTTTAYDVTFGFYSDDGFQTTPMTSFDENARPPPNWRGTQWELPPAPVRPKSQEKNEDKPTRNPNDWNQEANGWSGGFWDQSSNEGWTQPTRNRWNNQRRFRGGSRDTWREPIGNSRGRQRGSWHNSQRMSGDQWRRDMVGIRRSEDSGFRLRNTWRASKNGGEEQEGQEQ